MKATRKLVALFSAAVLALAAKAAAPSVVVDSVTPAYPYGTSVQTTYTVTAGDAGYSLKFYATINNEVYDVTDTVSEDEATRLNAGEHTVTWTAPSNKLDTNAGLALKVVETGAAADPETVAELKTYSDDTFATKTELSGYLTTTAAATTYQPAGSYQAAGDYVTTTDAASTYLTKTDAASTYQTKGNYLTAHQDISGKADKATTLAGYGITDAATSTQLNNLTTTVNGKADKATTLSGYGITDAYTKTEVDSAISKFATTGSSTTYANQPYMVVDLETGDVTYESNAPESYNTPVYKTTKMAFRRVPAGSYSCTTGKDYAANTTQTPNGTATMAKDYYIAIFECTEAQYNTIMGSGAKTSMKPKANITWNALRDSTDSTNAVPAAGTGVIAKLNAKTGLYFDLPTETMWQVAAQASGHPGDARFYGNDEYRLPLYARTSGGSTQDVGMLLPNQWGLYDVYGNVWEWCLDSCGYVAWNNGVQNNAEDQTMTQTPQGVGASRVFRGGCADGLAAAWFRSGSRSRHNGPTYSGWSYGFRLSRIVQ